MDIFNRPPAISEDRLQYALYPAPGQRDRTSVSSLAAVLQAHVDDVLQPSFVWHRDAFQLKVAPDPDGAKEEYILEGTMRVGDCVDDEWCVVWLLREISRKWDVIISVWDTDGDFLLIEAADALPAWVNPSNAENRVWIRASHLHLIPLTHVSPPSSTRRRRRLAHAHSDDEAGDGDDGEDHLTVPDAVALVRNAAVATEAQDQVESAVWRRIERYPAALREHVHVTKAWLPLDVARALAADPALVQKPIETFYTRDALQLRAAHKMARFPPQPDVLAAVRLTRTAYAQLRGQRFHPPKTFGRWSEREGSDPWRFRDVGMKIACGFEMLFQESKNKTEGLGGDADQSAAARRDALRRNPDYGTYITSLRAVGYFQDEVEGSQAWNMRENKAAMVFIESRRDDDASRPSFAVLVQQAISRAPADVLAAPQVDEDTEEWLNVDAADFDDMLARTMGRPAADAATSGDANAMDVDAGGEGAADAQAKRLRDLAEKVGAFVEGKGTVEGATFDDEGSESEEDEGGDGDGALSDFSDERFSDSDDEDEDSDEDDAGARQAAMDALVAPLGPDEYGKMPAAFHERSQRVTEPAEADEPAEEGADAAPVQMRAPLLPRDTYDGVDSDDESSEEEGGPIGPLPDDDEESDEDRPQVVGDGELDVDMGAEEDEFLAFARGALGLSDAQWADIVRDRTARGAFVPATVTAETKWTPEPAPSPPREPKPGARPGTNPNLDSFEAVMEAMETELAKQKAGDDKSKTKGKGKASALVPPAPTKDTKGKGKAKVTFADAVDADEDMDVEAAMDAELRGALERGDADSDEEEGGADYALIKNFLESFKSQAGLAGPVSNLAGRLQGGWTMPRDEA